MEKFRSALLLLAALASASRAEEIIYAQVGQKVTLKPPEGFKSGNYYLAWSFKDRDVAWTSYMNQGGRIEDKNWKGTMSDSSLTMADIQPEQFGTYECLERASRKTQIYNVLRLTASAKPSSVVIPGQTVTLACEAERPNSHQTPQIHWLDPQGEKTKQGSHEVRATSRHSGLWTCVVTLGQRPHVFKISITVVDLDSPPLQYTSKSSHLSIPCSIPARVPWEQIKGLGLRGGHWQFFPRSTSHLRSSEGQRLFTLSLEEPVSWKPDQSRGLTPASDFKNRNLSLSRKKVEDGDGGNYVCTLTFDSNLTLNRTVEVQVLEITAAPGKDLISGQQLNLTCSSGVPLTPDLRLKWIPPDGSSLQSLTSDRLSIPAVGTGDDGKWRCELWRNSTRLTSAVIELKIEPRLSVWMLVIICSAAAIVLLLLLILGFILCRRRRTRQMRPIRHRLCQCKNPKPKGFYRT